MRILNDECEQPGEARAFRAKGNILHIVHSQLTWLHPSPPSSLHVASPSAEQRVSPPPLSSSRAAMHGVHWLCLPPIVALELLWCARSLPGSVSNCRSMCRHWRGGRRRPNPPGSNGVVGRSTDEPSSLWDPQQRMDGASVLCQRADHRGRCSHCCVTSEQALELDHNDRAVAIANS